MAKLDSRDIHIISQNSNWPEEEVAKALKNDVYVHASDWTKFLYFLILGLAAIFTISGVVFFFAYNWADLHKFAKLGIVTALLLCSVSLSLFAKFNQTIRNVFLTLASILVGVLFAVFGQIYQTGANAYDFFLAWVVFCSLFVWSTKFPPLWLFYIAIINTTIILFKEQVAISWSFTFLFLVLFLINVFALLSFLYGEKKNFKWKMPTWFNNTMSVYIAVLTTFGICNGIFFDFNWAMFTLVLLAITYYAWAYLYGLQNKRILYLALIPFSCIIILSCVIFKIFDGGGSLVFFLISIFIVITVSFLIITLLAKQNEWKDD